jgi:hypothetical protein
MNAPLQLTPEQAFPSLEVNLIPLPDGHMGEFFGALAAAQGAFDHIEKSKHVMIRPRDASKAAYSFKYADLAEIRSKTTPALAANKLALTQLVTNKPREVGGIMIRTILGHASGARMEAVLDLPKTNGDVKDLGAYITYLRRYVVGPMLGIAADDDLDEDGEPPAGSSPMGYSAEPSTLRNPAPSNPAETPLLRDAKSIKELTTAFNKFSPENKDRFRAQYERLLEALDVPPPTAAAAKGATPAAAAAKPKDDL